MVKQNDKEDPGCGFGLSMNSHLFKRPGAAAAQVQHLSVHKMRAQRPPGELVPSLASRAGTGKLRGLREQCISPEPARQPGHRLFLLTIPLPPSFPCEPCPGEPEEAGSWHGNPSVPSVPRAGAAQPRACRVLGSRQRSAVASLSCSLAPA